MVQQVVAPDKVPPDQVVPRSQHIGWYLVLLIGQAVGDLQIDYLVQVESLLGRTHHKVIPSFGPIVIIPRLLVLQYDRLVDGSLLGK